MLIKGLEKPAAIFHVFWQNNKR